MKYRLCKKSARPSCWGNSLNAANDLGSAVFSRATKSFSYGKNYRVFENAANTYKLEHFPGGFSLAKIRNTIAYMHYYSIFKPIFSFSVLQAWELDFAPPLSFLFVCFFSADTAGNNKSIEWLKSAVFSLIFSRTISFAAALFKEMHYIFFRKLSNAKIYLSADSNNF